MYKNNTCIARLGDFSNNLKVYWRLLHGCNQKCAYCGDWKQPENTILVLERLIRICNNFLSIPCDFYDVTLSGGEPTLHPFLPDIVSHLSHSASRVRISIETNGSQSAAYYRKILRDAPPGTLRLIITLHPAFADSRQVADVLSLAATHAQRVNVRLMNDPQHQRQTQVLGKFFGKLREYASFDLEFIDVVLPRAQATKIPSLNMSSISQNGLDVTLLENDLDASDKEKEWPKWNVQAYGKDGAIIEPVPSIGNFKGYYCCHALNYLLIESDGSFYGAPCNHSFTRGPLWRLDGEDLKRLPLAIRCGGGHCPHGAENILPKFLRQDEAEQFIAARERQRDILARTGSAFPLKPSSGIQNRFLRHLRRLRDPENCADSASNSLGNFVAANLEQLAAIYEVLADNTSRNIFLRHIKHIESGNPQCLTRPTGSESLWPELGADEIGYKGADRYCDFIDFEQAQTLESLKEYSGAILLHRPRLRIPLVSEELLNVIPWLKTLLPDHDFFLEGAEDAFTLLTLPRGRAPRKKPHLIPGLVSIIIPTFNSEKTIQRCLESAIAQGLENIELIVVDDGSSDTTKEILREYEARLHGHLRWRALPRNMGPGPARNFGVEMASGEYLTFIDSDDALAPGFLKDARELMDKTGADIAAFDMLMQMDGKWQRRNVEAGEFAGASSLEALLLKKAGGYGSVGRMYRAAFVWENNIHYGATQVHQDMFFSISAFYYSNKTIVVSKPGYLHFPRRGSNSRINHGEKQLHAFASLVAFLTNIFVAGGLSLESEMYQYCIRRLYTWDRQGIINGINNAQKEGRLRELVNKTIVDKLGLSKFAMELVLYDYAKAFCHLRQKHMPLSPGEIDWRLHAQQTERQAGFFAYANADNPATRDPDLSVILVNRSASTQLAARLESILSQTYHNFELFICVDNSDEDIFNELADFADLDNRIRLYQCEPGINNGQFMNLALLKARGQYVVFIDSSSYYTPNYLQMALEIAEAEKVDLGIFSNNFPYKMQYGVSGNTRIMNSSEALSAFSEGVFSASPWAKIYRLDILKSGHCQFPEYDWDNDIFFCIHAMLSSYRIVMRNIPVYKTVPYQQSDTIEKFANYNDLDAAYKYFDNVDTIIEHLAKLGLPENMEKKLRRILLQWNIENGLPVRLNAFIETGAGVPVTEETFQKLANNATFWNSLFLGFTQLKISSLPANRWGVCVSRPWLQYVPEAVDDPLVSVIMAVYNQEKLLPRALDSLASQSLTNFELILIDDGSTDGTHRICAEYARQDSRIRLVRLARNRGLGHCRGLGLALAKGKYVAYADSDDICAQDYLLMGAAWLEAEPEADLAQFAKARDAKFKQVYRAFPDARIVSGSTMLQWYAESKVFYHEMPIKVWRRDFIKDLFLPEFMFEDTPFVLQAYAKARKIAIDPRPGYAYILNEHSASAMKPVAYSKRHLDGHLGVFAWISQFAPDAGRDEYDGNLAAKLIARFYGNLQNGVLPYIASSAGGVSPLTAANLASLRQSPELIRLLLEDCAQRWGEKYGKETRHEMFTVSDEITPHLVFETRPTDAEPLLSLIVCGSFGGRSAAERVALLGPMNDRRVELLVLDDGSWESEALYEVKANLGNAGIALYRMPPAAQPGGIVKTALGLARGRYIMFHRVESLAIAEEMGLLLANLEANGGDLVILGGKAAKATGLEACMEYMQNPKNGQEIFRAALLRTMLPKIECHADMFGQLVIDAALENAEVHWLAMPKLEETTAPVMGNTISANVFNSRLRSLRNSLERIRQTGDEILEQTFATWLFAPASSFIRDILNYIHSCKAQAVPSPLEKETITTLTSSDAILRHLMLELALLCNAMPRQGEKK